MNSVSSAVVIAVKAKPVRYMNRSAPPMLNTIWMTYDELADRLGIARESARQHVKRKQWPRRKDNQGRVQVGVPEEALPVEPAHVPVRDPEHEPVQAPVHEPDATTFMNRYIAKLEQTLEAAQQKAAELEKERDAARDAVRDVERERDAATAQVDALRTVLDVERQRVEEWKSVADRFASTAEKLATPEPRRGLFAWLRRA